MANLKFSQFTEQTDTANVQFLVGYNGSTNVRIAPENVSSLGGSGTLNTIAMFTPDGNTLGNSLITISNIGTVSETINSTSKVFQIGTAISGNFAQLSFLSPGAESIIDTLGSGDLVLRINNSTTNQFRLKDTGALQAKAYGNGTFTGTAAYTLSVDSSGNIIETTAGGGGSGTVTSVATTHAGNAFTASIGNVSTVNPSVDITLNGSASQYIDGAGNLTTFPTITTGTVESVGLSMPAAFSVASSPVTTSGTLTVTGAGTTAQYIRGDGTLNTFPTIPTVPANIVETVTTTDGTFIDLTPNTATDGAVTVTADLSATGTPNSSSYLRGDNTWATIPGGFTSFDITGGSGSAQTITNGNTVTLAQGTGISTVAGATDTVTITNTDTGSSQNIFKNVASDSGTAVADNNNDTLTISGGTNVSTAVVGDTLTITATDTNTTYTAGTGLTLSGTVFNTNVDGTQSVAANTSTTTAARTYKVQVDSSDNLVVNVPWTSGSGGIAGSLADEQIAFGNGTDTIAGSDDIKWNGNTLTLGGSTGNGNLSAVLVTGDAMTCNANLNLGTVVQHQGDANTKFGFPANDTFTIETNGLERLRIASAGQIGIGGTNYGTSGDVLTSNGPSAAPSWQAAGGGGASSLNDLSDVLVDTASLYVGEVPSGLSGNPQNNTTLGITAGGSLTTGVNNTIVGSNALLDNQGGSDNVVIGYNAAYNDTVVSDSVYIGSEVGGSDTSLGNQAVAIGYRAGYGGGTNTGQVVIGYNALATNAGSTNLIAIGNGAMNAAGRGSGDVAIGYNASYTGTSANSANVAVGIQASYFGYGTGNVAIGQQAFFSNANKNSNTVIGTQAGRSGVANENVVIGYQAGYNGVIGDKNTVIGGYRAGYSASFRPGDNCVLLGSNTTASSSGVDNEITLGDSNITTLRCAVTSITSLSDERDKTSIENLTYGLDFINSLQPKKFVWDNRVEINGDGKEFYSSKKGSKDIGFIAQDLQKIDNEWTQLVYESNPDKLEANYGRLVPILVQAIKELKAEIELLKNK